MDISAWESFVFDHILTNRKFIDFLSHIKYMGVSSGYTYVCILYIDCDMTQNICPQKWLSANSDSKGIWSILSIEL